MGSSSLHQEEAGKRACQFDRKAAWLQVTLFIEPVHCRVRSMCLYKDSSQLTAPAKLQKRDN